MFGLSYSEFVQGSALKTWNCVSNFANLLWYKFNHLRDPIMPRSRRRHHSRSRSRSRSHSHERDREPKRRKIESYDSPNHKRSVSSEPEAIVYDVDDRGIDETDIQKDASTLKISSKGESQKTATEKKKISENIVSTSEDKRKSDESQEVMETSGAIIEISEEEDDESHDTDESNDDSQLDDVKMNSDAEEAKSEDEIKEPKPVCKNITPSKLKDRNNDLKITPKKVLSPRQVQKKLDSEKKRQEKQKEKEEKERKRLDEKEKKELEKKRMTEEKLRLKQEKEEQRVKEKLAKEEKKKKEQDERDKKRKEKEEKDELKKKEREQEKLKKQQEVEEKNKEKQKLEEQKQKTAAAFVNFFVAKKTETEEKKTEESLAFMPFEVKSDMRLAPVTRKNITDEEKPELEEKILNQCSKKLYLDELKNGKEVGKCGKTWAFIDQDDDEDVVIVEENVGETIEEEQSKLEKMRAKFLKFDENQRPPYYGTFRKKSKTVGPRKPFGKDGIFNYEIDSDEEWEEEGEGESLKGTDDEGENENEPDNDYEVDNKVFVPHEYLSGDERDDEENAKLSPTAQKAKLKLLKNEFDEEMKSKIHKLKPKMIGCIWYNKTKSNVDEAIDRHLQPFAIICSGQIEIKKRSDFASVSLKKVSKLLSKEHIPVFLTHIHGSVNKRKNIVTSFIEYMGNNGVQLEVSKISLGKQLKTFAQWQKCPEEGAMHNKMCWYVSEDVRKEYNVDLTVSKKSNPKRTQTK